ncbi:MAG: hypothetical protein M3141_07325 [Actinomycetota bacterium]|nr:hypothetical protein [Actinomycetota bacterium]
MGTSEELLRRYQPQLRYDSNEAFFADSAAIYTDNAYNLLRRARRPDGEPGEILAEPPPKGDLSLDLLTHPAYGNDAAWEKGDHLSVTNRDYRAQATALHMQEKYANVVYGRVKDDSAGRTWLQYWYFYFFNDYQLAGGIGLHEGDWEMVQLRLDGDVPDLAVYCQHSYADTRRWDEVERDGDTPMVFVGRGSHAAYFEPGLHKTEVWFDIADGRRDSPVSRLELFEEEGPPWATWPGRWGDTLRRISKIDSPAPSGPGAKKQWGDPARLLEEKAPEHKHSEAPAPPRAEVRRHRGRLRVDYDFSAIPATEPYPDRLVITVNSRDDRVPPQTYTFVVDQATSGTIVGRRRLDDAKHYDINVSAVLVTRPGGTGTPTASRRVELPPSSAFGLAGLVEFVSRIAGRVARGFRGD